jgi:DNA-binding protein YbaB
MSDEMSWLEHQADQAQQRLARISAIHAELGNVNSTGRSPDHLVTATVSGHGKLIGVDIAGQAIRRGDPEALGRAVVVAVNAAFEAAQALNREKMSEVVDFSTYDKILGELRSPADDGTPPVIGF